MKKFFVFLLAIGMMLTGCGLGSEKASQDSNSGGDQMIDGDMVISLVEESPLVFNYEVMNQSGEVVTMEFSSSQRIDYSVTTKSGKEVFLFSSVSTFLQALGEEELNEGEKLEYTIDLNDLDLKLGEYSLSVWMTPMDGSKYKVIKEFAIK
ncbi:BsuPI-related putative proteinase inhibitor [Alkalihalobacterium elongatum]|uniref:BsuPI-related putative proteinase inhibitor n=1 Tax=Alkalihalobacterium elongatum TaxID=2675466 RepID=UPI001C1F2911|nr:BsuPI-related putative proteinase inhibitor [Alkalihalobacterium elongatum]